MKSIDIVSTTRVNNEESRDSRVFPFILGGRTEGQTESVTSSGVIIV